MDSNVTNQPLAVSLRTAAERLGVCERTVWTLVARGELVSRRIGRRRVIPVITLEAFLRRDHPTRPSGAAPEVGSGE